MNAPTAQQVQELRQEAGLTAQAFGELVYATVDSVRSWESGRRQMSASTWELLLIMFGKIKPRRIKKGKAS